MSHRSNSILISLSKNDTVNFASLSWLNNKNLKKFKIATSNLTVTKSYIYIQSKSKVKKMEQLINDDDGDENEVSFNYIINITIVQCIIV